MAKRTVLAPGEIYHIYNRGTEKRTVFEDTTDRDRFMALLYLANNSTKIHISNHQGSTLMERFSIPRDDTLVEIVAYCLMPNHFHLLIREKNEGGISTFMQKLATAYTMYFNTKYVRSGSLFQGRYKAQRVSTDTYLKYLVSYIHLNPVKLCEPKWKETGIKNKAYAKKYLQKYVYSSYLDYLGYDRIEQVILNTSSLPKYFLTHASFEKEISDWLSYKELP